MVVVIVMVMVTVTVVIVVVLLEAMEATAAPARRRQDNQRGTNVSKRTIAGTTVRLHATVRMCH